MSSTDSGQPEPSTTTPDTEVHPAGVATQTLPQPTAHTSSAPQPTHPAPTTWYGAHEPAGPVFPPPPAPGAAPQQQPEPQPRQRRRVGELFAVAALTAALASGGTYAATQLGSQDSQTPSATSSSSSLGRGSSTAPVSQSNPQSPNWTDTAAAVSPSVVAIKTDSGEGSGVIIDGSGHVLTNNHVVSGAQQLTVTLSDGRTFKATIQGTDPSTDLAVVTIQGAPDDLTPIAIGNSDDLKVGDPVMAIGNPLGLAGTVTTGIVSALNRPVTTEAAQEQPQQQNPFGNGFPGQQQQQSSSEPVVTNAIQTSAAINPGNSGGALVNANGQLVGINSSIASLGSSSSSQSGNIGIGFAIPVKEAASIADQLIKTGKAVHAYLGVAPVDGSASDGNATRAGAKLQTVSSGTPAEKAGLKVGDVITAVNGERVDSAEALVAHIREYSVGDTVKLTVLRNNATQELTATLATAPSN
ncbi:S1C family serine protease [Knoellia subterranea]|uniref:Peptidase n=1 Tax=Knoellia subterranea KCTC 19937 TaxID=1385521 RepID=A0A0A0JLX0_9MICO|nr:trypsin-like peptidase domain-containing protein [Knoellia subterranea]KGN36636.1 peptidase [Knoellia subterranea KCTC 19937]